MQGHIVIGTSIKCGARVYDHIHSMAVVSELKAAAAVKGARAPLMQSCGARAKPRRVPPYLSSTAAVRSTNSRRLSFGSKSIQVLVVAKVLLALHYFLRYI